MNHGKNNKSVPGEEIHSATTMVRNAEWAVLGNVTLSRPIGTEEYRIIPVGKVILGK